jgi:hypothetical protein
MTVDKQDILSPTETITEVVELTTLPVPDSKLQDETTRHANIFVAEGILVKLPMVFFPCQRFYLFIYFYFNSIQHCSMH